MGGSQGMSQTCVVKQAVVAGCLSICCRNKKGSPGNEADNWVKRRDALMVEAGESCPYDLYFSPALSESFYMMLGKPFNPTFSNVTPYWPFPSLYSQLAWVSDLQKCWAGYGKKVWSCLSLPYQTFPHLLLHHQLVPSPVLSCPYLWFFISVASCLLWPVLPSCGQLFKCLYLTLLPILKSELSL